MDIPRELVEQLRRGNEDALFTQREIEVVLSFLEQGGCLVAFAYRFGDAFTKTSLRELFSPLGCFVNDDAVVDAELAAEAHPFHTSFQTTKECIKEKWASSNVVSVRWRPVCTFTLLVGSKTRSVVMSPGSCIRIDMTHRFVSSESMPICGR